MDSGISEEILQPSERGQADEEHSSQSEDRQTRSREAFSVLPFIWTFIVLLHFKEPNQENAGQEGPWLVLQLTPDLVTHPFFIHLFVDSQGSQSFMS